MHCITPELEFTKGVQSPWASLEQILFGYTDLSCSVPNKIVAVIFCTGAFHSINRETNIVFVLSILLITSFVTRFYYLTPSQHQGPSWRVITVLAAVKWSSNWSSLFHAKKKKKKFFTNYINYIGRFDPWELKINELKSSFQVCRPQSSVWLLPTHCLSGLPKSSKAACFQRAVASWVLQLRRDWNGTGYFLSYICVQNREKFESWNHMCGWCKEMNI